MISFVKKGQIKIFHDFTFARRETFCEKVAHKECVPLLNLAGTYFQNAQSNKEKHNSALFSCKSDTRGVGIFHQVNLFHGINTRRDCSWQFFAIYIDIWLKQTSFYKSDRIDTKWNNFFANLWFISAKTFQIYLLCVQLIILMFLFFMMKCTGPASQSFIVCIFI